MLNSRKWQSQKRTQNRSSVGGPYEERCRFCWEKPRRPHLPESGVLDCDLAEEEVHIVPVLDSMEEMGFCRTTNKMKAHQDQVGGKAAMLSQTPQVQNMAKITWRHPSLKSVSGLCLQVPRQHEQVSSQFTSQYKKVKKL